MVSTFSNACRSASFTLGVRPKVTLASATGSSLATAVVGELCGNAPEAALLGSCTKVPEVGSHMISPLVPGEAAESSGGERCAVDAATVSAGSPGRTNGGERCRGGATSGEIFSLRTARCASAAEATASSAGEAGERGETAAAGEAATGRGRSGEGEARIVETMEGDDAVDRGVAVARGAAAAGGSTSPRGLMAAFGEVDT